LDRYKGMVHYKFVDLEVARLTVKGEAVISSKAALGDCRHHEKRKFGGAVVLAGPGRMRQALHCLLDNSCGMDRAEIRNLHDRGSGCDALLFAGLRLPVDAQAGASFLSRRLLASTHQRWFWFGLPILRAIARALGGDASINTDSGRCVADELQRKEVPRHGVISESSVSMI